MLMLCLLMDVGTLGGRFTKYRWKPILEQGRSIGIQKKTKEKNWTKIYNSIFLTFSCFNFICIYLFSFSFSCFTFILFFFLTISFSPILLLQFYFYHISLFTCRVLTFVESLSVCVSFISCISVSLSRLLCSISPTSLSPQFFPSMEVKSSLLQIPAFKM